MAQVQQNGGVSFWWSDVGIPPRRDPLPHSIDADVCIVGGGFTGLWTAYRLKRERPDLDVVILEREFAGFGASGRNGAWLTDRFAARSGPIEREHGFDAALALRRALAQSVDDVIAVCGEEGIEADIARGGTLLVARCEAQAKRLHESWVEEHRWTSDGADVVELGPAELRERINVSGARLGLWHRIRAPIHPAKLVRRLLP